MTSEDLVRQIPLRRRTTIRTNCFAEVYGDNVSVRKIINRIWDETLLW